MVQNVVFTAFKNLQIIKFNFELQNYMGGLKIVCVGAFSAPVMNIYSE